MSAPVPDVGLLKKALAIGDRVVHQLYHVGSAFNGVNEPYSPAK
jgi:hypothetical protein